VFAGLQLGLSVCITPPLTGLATEEGIGRGRHSSQAPPAQIPVWQKSFGAGSISAAEKAVSL